jgi:lipoprotein-anchoring transpeptidase ErfK/SrfK
VISVDRARRRLLLKKGTIVMYLHLSPFIKRILAFIIVACLLVLCPLKIIKANTVGTTEARKLIEVNITQQELYAYENGQVVFSTLIQSGRGSLPTPRGVFHVFAKLSPTTFTSPWPEGSPNWYPPTSINYALEFKAGGFFLHDATWHSVFGPGTNGWHYDPGFGWQDGSHGCVSMPLTSAAWLYSWAPIGTPVNIHD